MANAGVKYTNTFTASPVCSAMRSALITGMYQTSIGAHHHRTPTKSALPSGVDVITDYSRDAGYWTANGNSGLTGNGKTDYNFSGSFGDIYDGNDWRDRPADTPFFEQVQIYSPHRGFRGENTDPSRPTNLDLPDYYPDHELSRKDYADYLADVENFDNGVGNVLDRLEADGLADNTIVMIFGDHGAPHVRDKQWLYDGGVRIPPIIRDPTGTIRGSRDVGTSDDRMISHIDISATSLAAAGGVIPSHMQGVNFTDSSFEGREAVFAAKDRLDGVVDRVRSVQVGDLKLIRNFDPGTPYMLGEIKESAYKRREYPMHTLMKVMNGRGLLTPEQAHFLTESRPEFELYDLANDPNEFNNLADDPAYAGVLANLQGRIETWMVETNDMGDQFDVDAASEYAAMRDTYEQNIADRVSPDTTDYEYLEWWADQYDVDINLAQGSPQMSLVRLPNQSWENTPLNNGAWNTAVLQGWSEANSTVVQNRTVNQMANSAANGENALILNSDGGEVRWAVDDNWGNLVEFREAEGWEFEVQLWVGRRSDSQGNDAGLLEVSLQNAAGDEVVMETFDLTGVAQGEWSLQTFSLEVTDDVVGAAGAGEQLFLALANGIEGLGGSNNGRVLVDEMTLSVRPLLPGDLNNDGRVNAADYAVWRENRNNDVEPFTNGDADGDGRVTGRDFSVWESSLGESLNDATEATSVPEAIAASLILLCLLPKFKTPRRGDAT